MADQESPPIDPELATEFWFRQLEGRVSLTETVRWLNDHGYRVVKGLEQHDPGTIIRRPWTIEGELRG